MSTTPDTTCHMVAFWRRYGPERLAYGLTHDLAFGVPWMGTMLNAMGAIRACPDNGMAALRLGAAVLVFPGGDVEACRPFSRRYEIDFADRRGFARLAIRAGVPIVPIVSAGAHHSLYVMLPIAHMPLPVRIHTRILRPIHPGLPTSAADDPGAVAQVADRVIATMQRELACMRVAGRHGLFPKG